MSSRRCWPPPQRRFWPLPHGPPAAQDSPRSAFLPTRGTRRTMPCEWGASIQWYRPLGLAHASFTSFEVTGALTQRWVALGDLDEREGPLAAWGDQEVLPPGGGDEPFQAVVVICAMEELPLQVLRGLGGAHQGEEIGGRHEDQELELELRAARRDAGLARVG